MESVVWRYGVSAKGIKNRCRKVDWHCESERKGLAESASPDHDLALRLAHDWLKRNMKSYVAAEATITKWTLSGDGIASWQPFTAADNIKIKIV